jgi:hypothetical protein
MELFFKSVYSVLECPNIRLKKPSWLKQPSAMTVFVFLLLTYFLVTGGILKILKFNLFSVKILILLI